MVPGLPLVVRLAGQQLHVVDEFFSLMLDDDLINSIHDIHGNLGSVSGYCTMFAHTNSCSPFSFITSIQTKYEHTEHMEALLAIQWGDRE